MFIIYVGRTKNGLWQILDLVITANKFIKVTHHASPSIPVDVIAQKKTDTKRTRRVEQKPCFLRSHPENPSDNKPNDVRVQDEEPSRASTNYVTKEQRKIF